ncbi:energy-coupling factor ABC transporter ATP-binding protein [Bacillus solitudinis]|uniref:energy-coupling factor ABC transporter ATP-binding protein n=1 Tax=Bacillus solitudinis TaxID=2014074 RepID=UPI001D0D3786|nr:ATP-binding cassette domain-containing protein [Bacillus solitudinis]
MVRIKNIVIENLSYSYPNQTVALSDLSCSFSGSNIALLGANGSGKSTLLQHLNGLLLPQSGEINIFNTRVVKGNVHQIRQQVGLVFDNPENQLFATTVYEDVAFGPRNKGYKESRVEEVVNETLRLLKIEELKNRVPYHLSLGQKKKVAIAGVLAMEPKLLLFDEPFSGLDPFALEDFLSLLEVLKQNGKTIVLTTHDVDIAYSWADECMLMNQGGKIAQGTVSLLEDEQLMRQAQLSVPRLYQLFRHTSLRPKKIEEAERHIQKLQECSK